MSDKIREALAGVLAIVGESRGVDGYHLNGDIAEWDEFPEVEAARAALAQQPAQAVPAVRALLHSDSVPDDFRNQASGYRAGWNDCLAAAPAAPVAQEPVAWQDPDNLDRICSARTMLEAKRTGGATLSALKPLTRPLYATPPAAKQPTGTASDQYRAELYDEVWERARSMGYGNVTGALADLERMKSAEQPEKLLDQPAKVGAVRFHAGVSERLVIECAQRHYRYEQAPPFGDDQINSLAQALGYAKQPDTVKAPRELLDSAARSCANGWVDYHTARELRALLGKEGEA